MAGSTLRETGANRSSASVQVEADGQRTPVKGDVLARALVLMVLVAIADLWARHHLGWPLGNPAVLAGVLAVLGAAARVVDRVMGTKSIDGIIGWVATRVRRHVTWPALGVLGLLLALVLASFSSLTLVGESGTARTAVRVTPLDAPERPRTAAITPEKPLARMAVASTPFGRAFRIEVAGYLPATIVVHPITGRRIRPSQDLTRAPSVLFRPSALGMSALADGAIFRIRLRDIHDSLAVIATDSSRARGSFLLGPARPITGERLADWRDELVALGAVPQLTESMIRQWRQPARLESASMLTPGMRLVGEIVMHGTVVSSAEVTLDAVELVDVPLVDRLEE